MMICVYRRHGAVSSAGSTFSARSWKSLFVIFSSFLPMSLIEKLRFGFLGAAAVALASAAAPSAWASYVREYVPSSFFFNPGPGSKVTSVAAVRAAQQHSLVRRMAPAGAAAGCAGLRRAMIVMLGAPFDASIACGWGAVSGRRGRFS